MFLLKGGILRKTEQTWLKDQIQKALNQDPKTFGCQSGLSMTGITTKLDHRTRESTFWGFAWRTGHWYHTQDILPNKLWHLTMWPKISHPYLKINMSPEKGTILKGKFILQPSILTGICWFSGVSHHTIWLGLCFTKDLLDGKKGCGRKLQSHKRVKLSTHPAWEMPVFAGFCRLWPFSGL